MRLNNTNTAPDQRFFFPQQREVQHHESLDVDTLPGVIQVGDADNYSLGAYYVFVEEPDGTEVAHSVREAFFRGIPGGSTLLWLSQMRREQSEKGLDFVYSRIDITDEDFDKYFDHDDVIYDPHAVSGETHAIVELRQRRLHGTLADPRFTPDGFAVVPVNQPLPADPQTTLPGHNDEATYTLHGFVNPSERLVTWEAPNSYTTLLVDWCIANAVSQNALEEHLVMGAIPNGGHLIGLLSGHKSARAYLTEYDKRHGTKFLPDEDPRFTDKRFESLSGAQLERLRFLTDLAYKGV